MYEVLAKCRTGGREDGCECVVIVIIACLSSVLSITITSVTDEVRLAQTVLLLTSTE